VDARVGAQYCARRQVQLGSRDRGVRRHDLGRRLSRAALEAALQRSWSFDDLEIYGDALLDGGDPHGEVVALDRQPAHDDARCSERRRDALERWLGSTLAASAGHLVQHGFVHELRCSMHAPDLFETPLGGFVRGYAMWGRAPRVMAALDRVVERPRPWLSRLAIACWSGDGCGDAASRASSRMRQTCASSI
jgi:hypothetical protein